MSRARRRRSPGERLRAHDWELAEGGEWKCKKCGLEAHEFKRPSIYARVEILGSNARITPIGPGMLCDEYTAWKVHES